MKRYVAKINGKNYLWVWCDSEKEAKKIRLKGGGKHAVITPEFDLENKKKSRLYWAVVIMFGGIPEEMLK